MSARRLEIVSFEHDLDALKLALRPANADALGLTKDGANAHAAATIGLPNTISGGETISKISCCAMCAENNKSLNLSIGDTSATSKLS
jgi:hypothetical protein